MKTVKKIVRNLTIVLIVWMLVMAVGGAYPSARFAVWAAARRDHIVDYRVVQTMEGDDGARMLLLESRECLAYIRLEREGLFYRAYVPGAVLQDESAPLIAGNYGTRQEDGGRITWVMFGRVRDGRIARLDALPYGWEWLGEGETVWDDTARNRYFLRTRTVELPEENMWSEIAFFPYAEDGTVLQEMLDEHGQYAIKLDQGGEKR